MPPLISAPAPRSRLRFCWAPPRLPCNRLAWVHARLLPLMIAAIVVAPACGKKGPPLPPLSNRPRAPEAVSARRVGDQVFVRFTIPRANQSGVQPANIERVEVYALTGPRLQVPQFLKEATVVGSVQVRRPPPADETGGAAPAPAPDDGSLEQGAQGIVIETLGPAAFEPVKVRESRQEESRQARSRQGSRSAITVLRRTPLEAPDIGPAIPPPPKRFYSVVGVNRSGRRGSPSALVAVTLGPEPPAPAQPSVNVRRDGVEISWESPAGLRGPVREAESVPTAGAGRRERGDEEQPDADEADDVEEGAGEDDGVGEDEGVREDEGVEDDILPEADVVEEPVKEGEADTEDESVAREASGAGPVAQKQALPEADKASGPLRARWLQPWAAATFGYNVYAVPVGDEAKSKTAQHSSSALPQLLTQRPLTRTRFVDTTARFGQSRCYVVRVVETMRQAVSESASSPQTCVEVADVFPPSPPKSLAAVAGEGSINLIWEASTEPDVAGYLVLRAEAGSGKLEPITGKVIRETTWRDTGAKRGVRYVYAVVAVDNATPPNRSDPSNQVEETAR